MVPSHFFACYFLYYVGWVVQVSVTVDVFGEPCLYVFQFALKDSDAPILYVFSARLLIGIKMASSHFKLHFSFVSLRITIFSLLLTLGHPYPYFSSFAS